MTRTPGQGVPSLSVAPEAAGLTLTTEVGGPVLRGAHLG